ncbi:subtilisin-like protease SBT4.13 [Silene latifolia]|uniref:subtilisin-like protease SBT4.13 n=1 Tax=Silene latifolia TaxID=37657 RepID=UPI003D7785E5
MVKISNLLVVLVSIFVVFNPGLSSEVKDDRKEYIVYLGSVSEQTEPNSVSSQHINLLQQVLVESSAEATITRSYNRSFNGFAARMTEKEYEILKSKKEVVSIFPSRTLKLQTTRSWDFLGLPLPTHKQQIAESNVIIGVLDTGIWPESPSFYDDGFSPVPRKWKGVCHGGQDFTCNRKIIGARGYLGNARDDDGHGTHTASTAAGRAVEDIDFFGIAKGTVRGGVPSSRIAVYKVCDTNGCKESSILAAFDDAIADGVDLITISIGGIPTVFDENAVAIGAFHAMERGILTVQSAGNEGDEPGTVGSIAPWVFSVAASSTDRQIIEKVILGNGNTILGTSVNAFKLKGNKFPLIYGKDVSSQCDETSAKLCEEACLDQNRLKGKILVCDEPSKFNVALKAGALGVLAPTETNNMSYILPLPGASLSETEFATLQSYLSSTKTPTANIKKSEAISDRTAPVVAVFSSRGPNKIASDILKPDITAPGVDILAAYSPKAPISKSPLDHRSVSYSILSGTSMSCPHVAGAAAYLKSVHPHWTPAAIKSALMTTAEPLNQSQNFDSEFAYGSGHLNPVKATNPGLVYNARRKDYILFLCKEGYTKEKIATITGNKNVICPKKRHLSPKDVNYPSMSALIVADESFTVKFRRRVTNVGNAKSTYTAKVTNGSKIKKITVIPSVLKFESLKETKSFEVIVSGEGLSSQSLESGSLVWSDGVHSVRSPIVVYTN